MTGPATRHLRMTTPAALALDVIHAVPAQAACPGQTQIEMNDCAAQTHQRADAALNRAWGPAKQAMDSAGAGGALLDAQRKWIAFRDAACDAERMRHQGGSIAPLVYFSCMSRLTERRTQDLVDLTRN